jgi:UDP-glucose 4-epimerase
MRILVTGGAGFIGSHLSEVLASMNYEVTILDNLSTSSKLFVNRSIKNIKFKKGDIRDQSIVNKLTKSADIVFHLAAAVGVDNILTNPLESISTNFVGSEIVIKAALKFDKRIIIASTSEIYGKNSKQPLNETDDRVIGTPQRIRWTYSDSKALEEAIAYTLFSKNNLRVTTVRLFNTVGPRQSGRYGMVIPRFVNSALINEPLKVFGNGQQTRVFCHVVDTVKALVTLAQMDNTIGEVFNVGGKGEISILQLANLIISMANSNSKIEFISYKDAYPEGFEDMERRIPDISKIKSYINWEPKLNLNRIILDILNFNLK